MSPAPKLPPATSSPSSAPAQPGRRPGANLLVALLILAAVTLLILEWLGVLPLGAALATGYQWLILLGGVALLLGVVNVAAMHLWRIQTGQRDWVLSLVLLAVLLAVLTAGVISPAGASAPPPRA